MTGSSVSDTCVLMRQIHSATCDLTVVRGCRMYVGGVQGYLAYEKKTATP